MAEPLSKTGVVISCWDRLRTDSAALDILVDQFKDKPVVLFSKNDTAAISTILRDRLPQSYLADARTLSVARLARLCDQVLSFDGKNFESLNIKKPVSSAQTRIGFIVSNGYGLGHVTRMQAFAKGLSAFAPLRFMSFSAGLRGDDVYYLPSAQYLELHDVEGDLYTREAVLRFFNAFNPTHVYLDGNVLPPGMLAALAARPGIHLTWVRRGMWQETVSPHFMAQQAMADLVIEPGDISQSHDTGPSWRQRLEYCPPVSFLQTPPVRPASASLDREAALKALDLDVSKKYVLLMLGATQKPEDSSATLQAVAAVKRAGLVPVIAHWPISHDAPPSIDGVSVIEQIPLAPYYKGFDILISAAGYNSFHEILASARPVIFVPQEDKGRDQQLARARFAADRGYAMLCRRDNLSVLAGMVVDIATKPTKTLSSHIWLEDWRSIFDAMGASVSREALSRIAPQSVKPALFKAIYKRWKRNKRLYKIRMVVALDMDYQKLVRKLPKFDLHTIIVTDSVDPIALRRGGYKYVWLNALPTRQALFRQIISWLYVWRPEEMIIL